jgi:hypothetical protein
MIVPKHTLIIFASVPPTTLGLRDSQPFLSGNIACVARFHRMSIWTHLLQAWAYPMFFDQRHMGCKIPDDPYKGHGAPTALGISIIEVKDEAGKLATSWESSSIYTISVKAYGAQPVHMWLHASTGELFSQARVLSDLSLCF